MPFRSGEKNGEAPERGGGLFCSDRRGAGGLVHRKSGMDSFKKPTGLSIDSPKGASFSEVTMKGVSNMKA
jgi:hypothetical protein